MGRTVDVGAPAPAFRLATDGGGTISLADFRGRRLVLYFYPKADTPGCTQESIDFNACGPSSRRSKPRFSASRPTL